MTAEFGLAALWLAAALAALQLFAGGMALTRKGEALGGVVRPVAVVQGVLGLASFAALLSVFAQTDLSVKLVYANSHSAKPMMFKIAGAVDVKRVEWLGQSTKSFSKLAHDYVTDHK